MRFSPRLLALVATACLVGAADPAEPDGDHAKARAALIALKAAVSVIIAAEDSYDTDPASYRLAAQKAINVLVGERDPLFVASGGQPDDAVGAIGRIDKLLDRTTSPVWAPALHTVEVNERAAVGRLEVARKARELNDFQTAASQALNNLMVALGRPDDAGVFGGMEGAMATTELAVPAGEPRVDGCAAPSLGWGLHNGYLAFVAIDNGTLPKLSDALGIIGLAVTGNTTVLQTAAWPIVQQSCSDTGPASYGTQPADHAAATPPLPVQTAPLAPPQPAPPSNLPVSAQASSAMPALYTTAQAKAGEAVYTANCVSCHGPDLHGRAGPAVAGTDFLAAAKDNDWTLQQIQYVVTQMMPLNASGSLSPEQYANVMAFLLASDCLPAGSTAFPKDDQPNFADVKLGPLAAPAAGQDSFGVCAVK